MDRTARCSLVSWADVSQPVECRNEGAGEGEEKRVVMSLRDSIHHARRAVWEESEKKKTRTFRAGLVVWKHVLVHVRGK